VRARGQANTSPLAIVAYVTLPITAILMTVFLNLQVIQADIIYKTGLQFDDGGQPQVAIELYKRALGLAKGEDYYYLFLGRSYLNATAQVADAGQRETLLATAEEQLKLARGLNPLNTDHTANLARLNRRWAEMSPDANQRNQRTQNANDYYVAATSLSPNNAGLWNEWADLTLKLRGDTAAAQSYLDRSFALDEKFEQTYQLQGDLFMAEAQQQAADPTAQKGLLDKAIGAYQTGIELAQARQTSVSNARVNLASAYALAGRPQEAIDQYQTLLNDPGSGIDAWRLYLAISELQAQLGDMAQARSLAELALQAAPDADKTTVQQWVERLP
jgi:tetratricopeptide (TPR) repeat protein